MEGNEYYEEEQQQPERFATNAAPKKMGEHDDPNATVHYGTVINVPLCSLTKRKVTELKECYIALYSTFTLYKVVGRYDTPVDDDLPEGEWKSVKANYRWTRARCDISEVSMFYDNGEGLWTVQMCWRGAGEYNWHFERGADAKKLHDVLQNYFITRDLKQEPAPAPNTNTLENGTK